MNKLLNANFARLKKDKVFLIGMIVLFGIGAFIVITSYIDQVKYDYKTPIDSFFFTYSILAGIASAAFCSMFLGREYSDGTMRNKLIVGHKRSEIYLSNLIVCSAVGILFSLSFIAAVSAIGIPLMGWFAADITTLLTYFLISVLASVSYSAVFTLICMLVQNKAASAIVCTMGIFLLLFVAALLNTSLEAPEYYDGYDITTDGEVEMSTTPNPAYLTGTKRDVYQFLLDFQPMGQGVELSSFLVKNPVMLPIYSMIIIIATTSCGLLFFGKKDLK